jgi:hypothetical protein
MRFEKILPALRRGRGARRSYRNGERAIKQTERSHLVLSDGRFVLVDGQQRRSFTIFASEILATDWELIDG